MATSPMVGGADPAVLKSLEAQTPSVARTSPATVNAVTGAETSTGGTVSRGLVPQVSGGTVTYNQATQATAGNSVTVTSSTSNDPGDVVTIYTSPKAVSVSSVNQTVNTYKVNNYAGNEYTDSDVANYLPTFTGNVGAGNVNATGGVYTFNLSSTGLASLTTLTVSATSNLGGVGNVRITGGSNGQVLTTNGSGNLSWTSVSGGSYGNTDVANYLPTFTGNIGANVVSANLFVGSGANLTNIAGANVGGFVPNANVANTAFAVAGANVSGFVPNANVANTAFAVAAANVSGLGNIATINLDGNVSNVLAGNGTWIAASGGGANTGNVTFDDVTIQGVNGLNLSAGADFTANLAFLQVRAGDVASHIHLDTGNNTAYDLFIGDDNKFVQVSSTGNIIMSSYDSANTTSYVWTLDTTGNLTLPTNTFAVNYANGTQVSLGGGGGAAISNGTSNVSVVAADGNVVIGVDNDVASWTFATDGNVYAKPETDLILVVADPNGDGYAVKQSLTDGTTELSRTVLEDGQFSIYTNLDGAIDEWRFDGNTLQVTNNSFIRGFDANVTIQAMFAGTSGTASLQSVSNQNDPNIFSTFDATTTGANIKVYNGGSSGGVGYTWQFANDGRLTFPGTPRIDTSTNNFEVQAAEAINFEANTVVNIYTDTGNTTYQWQFGDDGNLTLPANTFAVNYANGTQVSLAGTYGNSNVVSLLGTFGSNTISTTGNIAVGAVSASGKIGYSSGSSVTQLTSRGTGVTINTLAGTIITTSVAMVANEIDTFSVINSSVDPNNDIVLAQIVSPNQGTYNCIANPAVIGGFSNGFYINIVNISGFTTADETITVRFMVIKAPNA